MPISQKFPAVRPTLLLDFAKSKVLDPRITFTRSTTATYTNSSGLITSAAVNTPRFDHDPITGKSLGLLVEEQRVNLLTYSDLSINGFTDGITVTSNIIVTPSGSLDGVLLTSTVTGGSNTCLVDRTATVLINTTYTFSVYLKAGTSPVSSINLYFTGGTFRQAVGTITWSATPTYVVSGDASATGGIQAVGNGWYRCYVVLNSNNNTGSVSRVYVRDQGTSNVTGHTLYAWGRQTEAGAFPTSYIPTVASQITRLSDVAVLTGTAFSDWYRADEGTASCSFSRFSNNSAPYPLGFTGGSGFSSSPRISFRTDGNISLANQGVTSAGNVAWNFSFSGGGLQNTNIDAIITFSSNSAGGTANGNAVVEVTPTTEVPTGIDKLFIGAQGSLNGHIKRITFYPFRLPNNQLETLTD